LFDNVRTLNACPAHALIAEQAFSEPPLKGGRQSVAASARKKRLGSTTRNGEHETLKKPSCAIKGIRTFAKYAQPFFAMAGRDRTPALQSAERNGQKRKHPRDTIRHAASHARIQLAVIQKSEKQSIVQKHVIESSKGFQDDSVKIPHVESRLRESLMARRLYGRAAILGSIAARSAITITVGGKIALARTALAKTFGLAKLRFAKNARTLALLTTQSAREWQCASEITGCAKSAALTA
jgi:hypothetical protein